MKTTQILLIGIIFSCFTALGQTKIKEIFQGTNSSGPKSFHSTTNHNFFFDRINWLYKTDGSTAGTSLLTDPNDPTFIFPQIQNSKITSTVGDKLLFRAYQTDDYKGQELWVSDGTVAGTFELKDINPGSAQSYPGSFIPLSNDKTLFTVQLDSEFQLWTTNGTESGTLRLKDFIPGTATQTYEVHQFDSTYIFSVLNQTTYTSSLWVSNGSPASTVKLGDINAESQFTFLNGFWYFSGNDDNFSDYELWKTDLTAAGTSRVKDIVSGPSGFYPTGLKTVNNKIVFSKGLGGNKELWESDGTETGTVMLKDINPGSLSSSPNQFIEFNNEVYFGAEDGTHGRELWKTNGTSAGTVLVKDINPNSNGVENSTFDLAVGRNFLGEVNNTLLFLANDGTHGEELWRTDGTSAGTYLVSDINPGSEGSNIDNVFFYNNEILFTAQIDDGSYEMFTSTGSPAGTQTFFDKYGNSTLSKPYILGKGSSGKLFFTAFSPTYGYELFKLVGSVITLVKDIDTNTESDFLEYDRETFVATTDSLAYFIMNDNEHGFEIWATDGTTANTNRISDFDSYPVEDSQYDEINYFGKTIPALSSYVTFQDTVYFNNDKSIYKIVGNSVQEWGVMEAQVAQLSADQDLLKWYARDTLFTYDGNITKSYYIDAGGFQSPTNTPIHTLNNKAYLFYSSSLYGRELYSVDLINSTVALVKDIRPGSLGYFAREFVKTQNHLFFVIDNALWISDGTTAGTFTIDINPSSFDYVAKLTPLDNEKIIFTANDGVHYQEVWVSDGTVAGTKMIEDLGPGNSIGNASALNISLFTEDQDVVYFFARGKLWQTKGDSISLFVDNLNGESPFALNGRVYSKAYTGTTAGWEPITADKEGFNILSDIYTGNESSFAQSFIHVDKKLFFLARDNSGRYAPYVFQTCPAELTEKDLIEISSTISSEFSITGTQNNVIQTGYTVNYETNNFILLEPGFNAESGAVFKAELGGGCVE